MKSGFISLLAVVIAGSALGADTRPHRPRVSALNLDLPPVSVGFPPVPHLAFSVEPRRFEPRGALCAGASRRYFVCDHSHDFRVVERKSHLPDPTSALGAAFLKCRAVTAEVIDPLVQVTHYPEGYFGDWAHDGLLVTARIEFVDEVMIGQIFALLMEAIGTPDEPFDYLIETTESETTLADYRRDTGFIPEMTFEFAGVTPLRVEINVAQLRMLVRAGDKWDSYRLDRWSSAALKEFLTASARTGGRPPGSEAAHVASH